MQEKRDRKILHRGERRALELLRFVFVWEMCFMIVYDVEKENNSNQQFDGEFTSFKKDI